MPALTHGVVRRDRTGLADVKDLQSCPPTHSHPAARGLVFPAENPRRSASFPAVSRHRAERGDDY